MLVSISSTTPDATDLGYLLHKHPDRVRTVSVGSGTVHVFYPEATTERCTATLLVEVDPIRLSRKKGRRAGGLEPYVNDRPYATSSMLSVAIGKLYGSAMAGNCEPRPELVDKVLDLEIELPVVSARGGEELVRRVFEPLGWTVRCDALALDSAFERWGDSHYVSLGLFGAHRVKDALAHLFVLLPVLDGRKHYWIGEDEIEKLLDRGGAWLLAHPDRELITKRYLRFGTLAREALARLGEGQDSDAQDEAQAKGEHALERPINLNEQRLQAVVEAVVGSGGGSVVDLGCGEGRLIQQMLNEGSISKILGIDVSISALDRAEKRINLDQMSERRRENISLKQGALTYTDERIRGFDVATVVEVIEHLDAERLDVFAQVVFGHASPSTVIVTTPNVEYNVHFKNLASGTFRHGDHRFEWSRAEFAQWADMICTEFGYAVSFDSIGPVHEETGPPTQMATFRKVPA